MIFYYFYINEQEYFEKAPIHQKNRIKSGMIRQFISLLDFENYFLVAFNYIFSIKLIQPSLEDFYHP